MDETTFQELLALCDRRIPHKVPKESGVFSWAVNGGDYLGSPGKDIYYALPDLTEEQTKQLVVKHAQQYPTDPPGNHVGNAACIRYIYGQFEKQGALRSEEDYKRMKKRGVDWSLSRQFIDKLHDEFERISNDYGLCLLFEMDAHRLGDESLLYKDNQKLDEMEQSYLAAAEYAHKCNSYKHMFTPYYWASRYFALADKNDKMIMYSRKTLDEADAYCPDARQSYVDKLLGCAKILKNHDRKQWKRLRKRLDNQSTNRCIRKMLKKI